MILKMGIYDNLGTDNDIKLSWKWGVHLQFLQGNGYHRTLEVYYSIEFATLAAG